MMMKNYDESIEINHNQRCPYIPNHSYRVLIIGGSGSGKTDALHKYQQPDIDKTYLCLKEPFKSKY